MPSSTRRQILGATGTAALGALAGCSLRDSDPPAGTLTLQNDDSVPHTLWMRVTGVGSQRGEGRDLVAGDPTVEPAQRTLSASASLDAGEGVTSTRAFTEPVWYAVEYGLADGPAGESHTLAFAPVPPASDDGRTLRLSVSAAGETRWTISSTANEAGLRD